ncbi:unnamed protein product [Thelazia callipaeda]|uniref:inositol-phosphate phosphatase n=1 Tax=Thelazia callipaeda TaxID=103827 RepID=A0A0N5D633_THECL|nr:unnamed protein product [Thelazia callipaeda]
MNLEMPHTEEEKFFNFALKIVARAGALVRTAFEQPYSEVHTKLSNTDLVTETDQAVEKLLIDNLSKQFPDHKLVMVTFIKLTVVFSHNRCIELRKIYLRINFRICAVLEFSLFQTLCILKFLIISLITLEFRHRSFGSAALNMVYVAQGIVDAYVEYGVHAWDMAAAGIIVKEAGGILLDPTGTEFDVMGRRVLCASTPELAKAIASTLDHVEYEKEG